MACLKRFPILRAVNGMLAVKSSGIAQTYCAISRLSAHNLKIGAQFPDSKNALHNLEIAQIPKLHRTCMDNYFSSIPLFWRLLDDSIYATGTMRTNRKFPGDLLSLAKRGMASHGKTATRF